MQAGWRVSRMAMQGTNHPERPEAGGDGFTATHWSVVMAVRQCDSTAAREALEKLCRTYWYPLYAFVRRQGYQPSDAEDLTQGFFERVIEKNYLQQVDRAKGRFRAFLLAALKHFLSDQRDRERAAKRGGGRPLLSLDTENAEKRYGLEPADTTTPEDLYERRWAAIVMEQARVRLREEYASARKGMLYYKLRVLETDDERSETYAEVAAQLGMTESGVKSAAQRMRQRYGELLREEIAHTVASPAEIDEELKHLLAVVGEGG
jgi:RNA polymerase sigma factor (sigma-70 family)